MPTKKRYPSEQQDRFIVRLPDGMRDRLAAAAKASGRSMNAEIVARLESTIEADEETRGTIDELWRMVEALERRMDRVEEAAGGRPYDNDD